jgi:hypothetical protein
MDAANTKVPQLLFQCKAIQNFHSQNADKSAHASASSTTGANSNVPFSASTAVPTPQNKHSISSLADDNSNAEDGIVNQLVPRMSSPCPSAASRNSLT